LGGADVIFGPYAIDNLLIDGYDVVVNKPKTEAYRAPGGTNAAFACETVLDEICEALGMDPLAFRLLNAAREGDRSAGGVPFNRIGFVETLQAAMDHPHYAASLAAPRLRCRSLDPPLGAPGRTERPKVPPGPCALALGTMGQSSASASLNPDGTISLVEGSVDIGGTRASIAMQLAETLGLAMDDIRPVVGDTDAVGYTEGTYGSRTTYATGWAAYELGLSLRRQMIERLADLWELNRASHFESRSSALWTPAV
jgi:CO/xanthine dehydrogenase Mo-binding subunit